MSMHAYVNDFRSCCSMLQRSLEGVAEERLQLSSQLARLAGEATLLRHADLQGFGPEESVKLETVLGDMDALLRRLDKNVDNHNTIINTHVSCHGASCLLLALLCDLSLQCLNLMWLQYETSMPSATPAWADVLPSVPYRIE
jgi:hypothetical protein